MNKYNLSLIFVVTAMIFSACGNKNKPEQPTQPADTTFAEVLPDSTLYGIAAESGMSTLYLITNAGDTIVMERTGEDGSYSKIYGYIMTGDSFAVTKRGNAEDGYTLTNAYNLSLINRFDVKYSIRNGLFVVNETDTVNIKSLNDDSLVVELKDGTTKTYPTMKQKP